MNAVQRWPVRARWARNHVEPKQGTLGHVYRAPEEWGAYWSEAYIFVPDGDPSSTPAYPCSAEDFEIVED